MLIHEDRLFPADPADPRRGAAPLRHVKRPADRLPARPHRSALVRRERAVPRSGAPLRRAGPLHLPHALQPGRPAARTSASRRRDGERGRDGRRARSGGSSPSTTICSAARRRGSGSTTPSRRCSASSERLSAETADHYYDPIAEALAKPEFRPRALVRALQHRGDRDDREPARRARDGTRRSGDSRLAAAASSPAYRPDPVVDPDFEGFRDNVARFGEITGEDTATWARLSRRAPQAARLLQDARRDLDRSRPSDRAHRRPAAARGRGAVPARRERPCLARGCGAVPRPDADRDGADEPRRRARDADPSGLVPQPQSRPVRALRPRHGRRHPDADRLRARAEAAARPLRQRARA